MSEVEVIENSVPLPDYTNILNDMFYQVNHLQESVNVIESQLVTSSTAIMADNVQNLSNKLDVLVMLFIVFMVFEIVKIRGERR